MGYYFLFFGVPFLFAIWAQMRVKSAFGKYSKIGSSSGLTGAQAATEMLSRHGLQVVGMGEEAQRHKNAVAIERVGGFLGDHYDPRQRVLRLSPKVYEGRSLAAVGVACHEAGHALQHAQGYAPLEFRSLMVPVASFSSKAAFPIIFLGFILNPVLGLLGIALYAVITLFQMMTLPVEFNASSRAREALTHHGIIRRGDEEEAVAAVLNAAALTYVAAFVGSVMTLLYYVLVFTGGGRD